MSRQNAHPLICETRKYTRSSKPFSNPLCDSGLCNPSIALTTFGVVDRKSNLCSIANSFSVDNSQVLSLSHKKAQKAAHPVRLGQVIPYQLGTMVIQFSIVRNQLARSHSRSFST